MIGSLQQNAWQTTNAVLIGLILLVGSVLSQPVSAVDDWEVAGEHGEINVAGFLSEGACQLDMTSAFQQVDLGIIGRHVLAHPGDSSQPVTFQIKLSNCARSGGNQTDRYTGNNVQDDIQPVVTLSFTGVADLNMPLLLRTTGVSGIGLRLTDPQGRTVRPGERGEPLMLVTGDNILTYAVTAVRTPAELSAGQFQAVTNFEVSYD